VGNFADDIYGIGFMTADKIARNIGVSPWSKYRYQSGLLHILSQAAEEGQCFLPQPDLMRLAAELLTFEGHEADLEAVDAVIDGMGEQKELIVEVAEQGMPICYSPVFFNTEQHLAYLLRQRLVHLIETDLERVRNWIERFTQSRVGG
jgi:exodeoxyribonuclease V alpha subunit